MYFNLFSCLPTISTFPSCLFPPLHFPIYPHLAWPCGSSDNTKTPFQCFIRATWALSAAAQTDEEEMLISTSVLMRKTPVRHKSHTLHVSLKWRLVTWVLFVQKARRRYLPVQIKTVLINTFNTNNRSNKWERCHMYFGPLCSHQPGFQQQKAAIFSKRLYAV